MPVRLSAYLSAFKKCLSPCLTACLSAFLLSVCLPIYGTFSLPRLFYDSEKYRLPNAQLCFLLNKKGGGGGGINKSEKFGSLRKHTDKYKI